MNAVEIGPLVFDGTRFAAVVALLAFFVVAEIVARVTRRSLPGDAARWTVLAGLAWVVGARVGFVAANAAEFTASPLDAFRFWQGGFLPGPGWAAGGAVFLLAALRRERAALAPLALGGAAAIGVHLALTAAMSPPDATMPQVQLMALDGSTVQLAGRDRPLVLNLWATWCPPCRREMPMMTELAEATPGVDFVFANQGEDAARIIAFLESEGLPHDGMARDPQNRLMAETGAVGLPSTLVFAANGDLVAAQTGEVSRAALSRMMDEATGGQR